MDIDNLRDNINNLNKDDVIHDNLNKITNHLNLKHNYYNNKNILNLYSLTVNINNIFDILNFIDIKYNNIKYIDFGYINIESDISKILSYLYKLPNLNIINFAYSFKCDIFDIKYFKYLDYIFDILHTTDIKYIVICSYLPKIKFTERLVLLMSKYWERIIWMRQPDLILLKSYPNITNDDIEIIKNAHINYYNLINDIVRDTTKIIKNHHPYD